MLASGYGKAMGLLAASGLATALILAFDPDRTPPWQKLEDAWRERHPDAPLPAPCRLDQFDFGTGDMDATPGEELVVASDRLGVALFAENGDLLAFRDSTGCRDDVGWQVGGMARMVGVASDGVVIFDQDSHVESCRRSSWSTLLRRDGDALVLLARYRHYDHDRCGGNDIVRSAFDPQPTEGGVVVETDRGQCKVVGNTTSADCAFLVEK